MSDGEQLDNNTIGELRRWALEHAEIICNDCHHTVAARRWDDHKRWHVEKGIAIERAAQRATAEHIDAWLKGRMNHGS